MWDSDEIQRMVTMMTTLHNMMVHKWFEEGRLPWDVTLTKALWMLKTNLMRQKLAEQDCLVANDYQTQFKIEQREFLSQ